MKADDALRQLPVVVFTTSSSEGDVAYCYKHFVNAYHVKPMNIAQFESDVSALLDYWFTRAQSPILE
jgi:CheY-like chemotaxis protein